MGEGSTIYESLINKFTYIKKEKFFKMAFGTDEQNCLKQHDFELILDFYLQRIQKSTGRPASPHIEFLLEMYCYGSIYMTVQWISGKNIVHLRIWQKIWLMQYHINFVKIYQVRIIVRLKR